MNRELDMGDAYDFTTDWFSRFGDIWRQILTQHPAAKLLEIGSYEGRSACFLIEECAKVRPIELHCIDTWSGGVEHEPTAMAQVEARFDANIARAQSGAAHPVALHKHKAASHSTLVQLLAAGGAETFDLIYVDGSHQAPDVLADAVLAFQLLKVGGVLIFDDYLWSMEAAGRQDFYNMPKPAIDAFINVYQRKVSLFGAPLYQLYLVKTQA
ncbi:MAG: class I SAM-dependent methyltransferase [Phenylobacterium sp.]